MAIDPPPSYWSHPQPWPRGGERAGQACRKQQQHPRPPWVGHQDGDGRQGKDRGDHMLMQTGELRVSDGPQYMFHMLRHHG